MQSCSRRTPLSGTKQMFVFRKQKRKQREKEKESKHQAETKGVKVVPQRSDEGVCDSTLDLQLLTVQVELLSGQQILTSNMKHLESRNTLFVKGILLGSVR